MSSSQESIALPDLQLVKTMHVSKTKIRTNLLQDLQLTIKNDGIQAMIGHRPETAVQLKAGKKSSRDYMTVAIS